MQSWNNNASSSNNCSFPEEYLCTILINVRRSLGVVSVVGTLIVLVLILLLRRYKLLVQRLILYLTLSACFDGIGYILGTNKVTEGPLCTFQGFWLQFFDWMVVVWMCNITTNLLWNVFIMRHTKWWFEVFYLFISFLIPLIFASIPFTANAYGPAGLWCWIDNDTPLEKTFRFAAWYIPTYIIIFFMFLIYIIIICRVTVYVRSYDPTNPYSNVQKELLKKEIFPLMKYPCVYLLLNLFPLANRIQDTIMSRPIFVLSLLQAVSSPILGLCLALVFALDTQTLKELKWSNLKAHLKACCRDTPQMREYEVQQGEPISPNEHPSDLSEYARLVGTKNAKVI